jgi:hypothetical protein
MVGAMTPEQVIETHRGALDKRLQTHLAVRVLGAEIDSVHQIQNDLAKIPRAEAVK